MWRQINHICILIILQKPVCIQISFVFLLFFRCLVSFTKIRIILTSDLNLICVFIPVLSKLTEIHFCPKCQLQPCCFHLTIYMVSLLPYLRFKTQDFLKKFHCFLLISDPSVSQSSFKLNSYSNAFSYRFVACAFPFFEVKSVLPIDRYQNATSKAISLHELIKVQLQERYTLVTQDTIGHLKTLCMSVLSLVVALESEWKRYSSSQSIKKTLVFEYEFSFRTSRLIAHSVRTGPI